MQVKYLGPKPKKGITLPVGVKHRGKIKQVVWANPFAELPDEEALKLVSTHPDFQIVQQEPAAGCEIHEEPPKRPVGRPKKVSLAK